MDQEQEAHNLLMRARELLITANTVTKWIEGSDWSTANDIEWRALAEEWLHDYDQYTEERATP